MRMTQGNTRHTLTVCFSYTSRNEIATATGHLAAACTQVRDSPDSDPRPYPDTGQARALALALALALTVTLTLNLTLTLALTLALTKTLIVTRTPTQALALTLITTQGKLEPSDISEHLLEQCLLTSPACCPPVDLLVRTSGESEG